MNKVFCDRCKKDLSSLKIYELVQLKIEDMKMYATNDDNGIQFSKCLCQECATDFIKIFKNECEKYKLKTEVLKNE